jgi:hypothetical protein
VNHYGVLVRQHQKRWRPASYAVIMDPETCFADLGEQAASEVARLRAQVRDREGNPPGEGYLHPGCPAERAAHAGRGNRARRPDPAATRTRPAPCKGCPARGTLAAEQTGWKSHQGRLFRTAARQGSPSHRLAWKDARQETSHRIRGHAARASHEPVTKPAYWSA